MIWARMLAYITGTVDQELLLRNEYLAAENRILRAQIKGRMLLSDAEKATLAEIAHRLGRKALEELAAVAKPDTLLAWYRKLIATKFDGSKFRKSWGRPRVDEETERVVLRRRALEGMPTPQDKALLALRLLVEGTSIRSIERTTELHRDTILRLLVLVGEKCEKLMGRVIVNVPVEDVQCDEIWGYVFKKEAHKLPAEANDESIGDAYCFVAIERNYKLVLNFALGRRSQATTDVFIEGLRQATAPQRFQLSTDGFQPYVSAITTTLSDGCDFAQLIKVRSEEHTSELQSLRHLVC